MQNEGSPVNHILSFSEWLFEQVRGWVGEGEHVMNIFICTLKWPVNPKCHACAVFNVCNMNMGRMQIRFIMLPSNELLCLIRWMAIREQKDEGRTHTHTQKKHVINQPSMLGYQQPSSPVITIIVIMTAEGKHRCESKLFKKFSKGLMWRRRNDGREHELMVIVMVVDDEDENGTVMTTEWERSCSGPGKQNKKTTEMWILHGGYFLSSLNEI